MQSTQFESALGRVLWVFALVLVARVLIGLAVQFGK